MRRPNDPRAQTAVICAMIALRLKVKAFVIENTPLFTRCSKNPTFRDIIHPMMQDGGYRWQIVRSDLSKLGVPSSRLRVFCVATRYDAGDELLTFHRQAARRERMALSDWFPTLGHYRSLPCKSSQGI